MQFDKRRLKSRYLALTRGTFSKRSTIQGKDVLTGLLNRRGFASDVDRAIAVHPQLPRSLLMVNVKGLTRISNMLGHASGDEALRILAYRLMQSTAGSARMTRLEDHRFALWMEHDQTSATIGPIVPRIQQQIAEPLWIEGMAFQLRSAVGIAHYPQHGGTATELLRKADIATAMALPDCSSSCRVFDPSMEDALARRDMTERKLRQALESGRIVPHYQPIVSLRDGRIHACEALARCLDDEPLLHKADQFIPIAEKSGLIHALSDQLLQQACTDAREWPPGVMLSFNVSPTLLHDHDFAKRFLHIVARTGFHPARIEVEITESALVQDIPLARTLLDTLRQTGVRLALDDFGTGCSSLQHLQCFQVNRLKIERTFIERLFRDRESKAIVKSLVALGHELNVALTAEGVEEERQRQFLAAIGCDEVQGFLISKPVPADVMQERLSAQHPVATPEHHGHQG